jgi:hypothetical protein
MDQITPLWRIFLRSPLARRNLQVRQVGALFLFVCNRSPLRGIANGAWFRMRKNGLIQKFVAAGAIRPRDWIFRWPWPYDSKSAGSAFTRKLCVHRRVVGIEATLTGPAPAPTMPRPEHGAAGVFLQFQQAGVLDR